MRVRLKHFGCPAVRQAMISKMLLRLFAAAWLAMPATAAFAQSYGWESYRDPEFGFSIDLPLGLMEPAGGTEGRMTFVEPGGSGQLVLYAEYNREGRSLEDLKTHLARSAGVEEVTYERGGNSWFVLSGYFRMEDDDEDEVIFYLKLMQSADRSRHAIFALNYPRSEKARYDPIVERLEASFRRPR